MNENILCSALSILKFKYSVFLDFLYIFPVFDCHLQVEEHTNGHFSDSLFPTDESSQHSSFPTEAVLLNSHQVCVSKHNYCIGVSFSLAI